MPNIWPIVGFSNWDGGEAAAKNKERWRDEEVRARSPRPPRRLQALLEWSQGPEMPGLDGKVSWVYWKYHLEIFLKNITWKSSWFFSTPGRWNLIQTLVMPGSTSTNLSWCTEPQSRLRRLRRGRVRVNVLISGQFFILRCIASEPRHGELWCSYTKDIKHWQVWNIPNALWTIL